MDTFPSVILVNVACVSWRFSQVNKFISSICSSTEEDRSEDSALSLRIGALEKANKQHLHLHLLAIHSFAQTVNPNNTYFPIFSLIEMGFLSSSNASLHWYMSRALFLWLLRVAIDGVYECYVVFACDEVSLFNVYFLDVSMVFVFCLFRYKIVWLQLLCQSSIDWILVSCYHPFEFGRSSCSCLVSFSLRFFFRLLATAFSTSSFSLSLVFVSVSMSLSLLNVCKCVCVCVLSIGFCHKIPTFSICLIYVCVYVFRIARQFSTKLHCVIMRVHIYDFPL